MRNRRRGRELSWPIRHRNESAQFLEMDRIRSKEIHGSVVAAIVQLPISRDDRTRAWRGVLPAQLPGSEIETHEHARRAAVRLEAEFAAKAIPVLGIAASAGIDMLSTYLIGRRTQAYFQRGPEALNDWNENARILTGIDERKVSAWLAKATKNTWQLASRRVQNVTTAVIVTGKSTAELAMNGASKVGRTMIASVAQRDWRFYRRQTRHN